MGPRNLVGIVLEDAPNGVLSGKAAGCTVIAVLTSHTRAQLEVAQPDFIIEDLRGLDMRYILPTRFITS